MVVEGGVINVRQFHHGLLAPSILSPMCMDGPRSAAT